MLPALSPGMTTLSSPPLSAAARLSRRSLPFCFSAPWHLMQDLSKIGLMSFAYVTPAAEAGGGSLLVSTLVFFFSFSAAWTVARDKMRVTPRQIITGLFIISLSLQQDCRIDARCQNEI